LVWKTAYSRAEALILDMKSFREFRRPVPRTQTNSV
jgi:hypothetical protein